MQNLFEAAVSHLAPTLKGNIGRSVSYRRANGTPVTLTATPTRHLYEVLQGDGALTQIESWDWIITAADLAAIGDPIPGDEIAETINDVATVYEVFEIGIKPCFEWSDTAGILWVIHSTKTEAD